MLGTSDAWSTSHLSQQTRVLHCRLSDFTYVVFEAWRLQQDTMWIVSSKNKILTGLTVLAVLVPNWCWRCYWRKCPEILLPGCGGQACGVVVGSDPIMHMVASNFLETQYAHENTNSERPKLFCRIFVLIKMQENFLSKRFWYSAWCIYYSKASRTLGWSLILMPSPISMHA